MHGWAAERFWTPRVGGPVVWSPFTFRELRPAPLCSERYARLVLPSTAVSCGDPPCVNNSMAVLDGAHMDDVANYTCRQNHAFPDGTRTAASVCEMKNRTNGTVYGEWTPIDMHCERELT